MPTQDNLETEQLVTVKVEVTVSEVSTTDTQTLKDAIETVLADNFACEYTVVNTRVSQTYPEQGFAKGICTLELLVPVAPTQSLPDATEQLVYSAIQSEDRVDLLT